MSDQNPLTTSDIRQKLGVIEAACHNILVERGSRVAVPEVIARDVHVLPLRALPKKKGVESHQGQARLLHDLASIELQAMELGFRTLLDYSQETPLGFKQRLVDVILDESRHLRLCLQQISDLGYEWGDWPVHTALWDSVSSEDSLLDRILIVHRYLEGSGLDASEKLLRRLDRVGDKGTVSVVKTIAEEEIGHVQFGSHWYKYFCKQIFLDPDLDFKKRSERLFARLPRRLEPIQKEVRQQAGFTEKEIEVLEGIQNRQKNRSVIIDPPFLHRS